MRLSLALATVLLLCACSMSFLNIERPLRGELPSGAEDIPTGRVFVVQNSTLHVLNILREGDQIRILSARSIEMSGGDDGSFAQSLMTDPERVFRLTPGGDNILIQLTVDQGGDVGYSGLFGRRRCRADLCIVELRDTSGWRAADAAQLGYLQGNGGVTCNAAGDNVTDCTLRDPAAFARIASYLDQSDLLRGEPAAYLAPSARQP